MNGNDQPAPDLDGLADRPGPTGEQQGAAGAARGRSDQQEDGSRAEEGTDPPAAGSEPLHRALSGDTTDPAATAGLQPLYRALAELRSRSVFDPSRIATGSRFPGGRVVHRTTAKVVSRQTSGIMEQTQAFAEEATRVLELLTELVEDHAVRVHPELLERMDAALERVARTERAALGPDASVADLQRRIERLEAAEARRGFRPWFANERFEEQFRGSRAELLDRYRDLAARLQGCGPVLDIGFGRGELLELLGEIGVTARGVEIDPALVEAGRARGLDVGIGAAEAPRGTLIHHYVVDDDGIVQTANLIIATGHNASAMNASVKQVATHYVKGNELQEGMLNRVEAVIRCYDPCLSCSTHAMGQMPLDISLLGHDGQLLDRLTR